MHGAQAICLVSVITSGLEVKVWLSHLQYCKKTIGKRIEGSRYTGISECNHVEKNQEQALSCYIFDNFTCKFDLKFVTLMYFRDV